MVTFEGKSEYERAGEAYSAVRLCTVSQQLVNAPITLQINDGHHATHYDIIFDLLTIPGWLPPSLNAIDSDSYVTSSTSYSLFATAIYHVDNSSQSTSTLSPILQGCSFLWSKTHKAEADRVEIQVIRHLAPIPPIPSTEDSLFPFTRFSVSAQAKEGGAIPNEIISNLETICSIPTFVATTEPTIPIVVKTRVKGALPEGMDRSELAIERIEVDVDQHDHFRSKPDDEYTSRFSLPSEQPPDYPLLHRSPWDNTGVLGMLWNDDRDCAWTKTQSVMKPGAPSSFYLQSPNGLNGSHSLGNDWSVIRMNAQLDISSRDTISYGSQLGKSCSRISPLTQSPFHRVTHVLRIATFITYQGTKQDVIRFSLPVYFLIAPESISTESSLSMAQTVDSTQRIPASTTLAPRYQPLSLPAYAQLFYDDGEARIDASRGVPPAYKDKPDGDEVGRKVTNPELVPVGTQLIDLDNMRSLID